MPYFVLALFAAGVLSACIRSWRSLARLPAEPRRSVPWNLWLVLALFLTYFFGQGFAALGALAVRVALLGEAHDVRQFGQAFAREAQGLGGDQNADDPQADEKRAARFATLMLGILAAGTMTIVGGWLAMGLVGARMADLGLSREHVWEDILWGVRGFFAFAPPVYLLQNVLRYLFPQSVRPHEVEKTLAGLSTLSGWSLTWIFGSIAVGVAVMAPLVEEYLFRVGLQGWCEKWWRRRQLRAEAREQALAEATGEGTPGMATSEAAGAAGPFSPALESPPSEGFDPYAASPHAATPAPEPEPTHGPASPMWEPSSIQWAPIAAASLLFAGAHITQWPDPVPLFFFSMGLGYLYQRTHRFLPSVVTHACLNGFSMLMLWIALMTGQLKLD